MSSCILHNISHKKTYPTCLSPSYARKRGPKIDGDEQLSVRGTVVFNLKAGQISCNFLHVALYGCPQGYGPTVSSESRLILLLSTIFEETQEGVEIEVERAYKAMGKLKCYAGSLS